MGKKDLSATVAADEPVPSRPDGDLEGRNGTETFEAFPLSFAQQRLWFLDQLEPGSSAYNVPIGLRISGALDVEALERSLTEITNRHESLRTVFPVRNGLPVQVICEAARFSLRTLDLLHIPLDRREVEALRLASEESAAPFDLVRGPAVRGLLLVLGEEDQILVVTMHHIVSDGWSVGIFLSELGALYGAFRKGRPSPLADLPIRYVDYAVWQREHLEGETLERYVSYWRDHLGGTPTQLDLPTDRGRNAVASDRGAAERATLPKALLAKLRSVARQEKATLFMTMLAAFQTLLGRLTGQEDIWVGTPIAGRTQVEVEPLIGFFVNTIVFRSNLAGDPTFRQLLGSVREEALGAYAHQELPFERLVEELQPQRNLSLSPLFQVMFSLQEAGSKSEIPGLRTSHVPLTRSVAHFDLSLSVSERTEGLSCSLEYRTELFDTATVRGILDAFQVLLEGIAADPDRRISRLPLVTPGERRRLIVDWNATDTDFPSNSTIHRQFEIQAARTPDVPAVEMNGAAMTYADLNCRANQLARFLRREGIGPGVLVAVYGDRSPATILSLLGVLKSGAAYFPLDRSYPAERLRFLMEDSGAAAAIAPVYSPGSFPGRKISLPDVWGDIELQSVEDLDGGSGPDDLAYVIYTSGSTGKPKGVEIEHRSLVNYAKYAGKVFNIGEGERLLQFASLSFDTAMEEIFSTLTAGGTLVLRSDEMIETVRTFFRTCLEWRISVLDLPTAYWHEIVSVAVREGLSFPDGIRLVIIGGEPALRERLLQWRTLVGGGVRLLNGYGPTEVTVVATFWEMEGRDADLPERSVPIGRPIANARTYVLGAGLEPVPVGFVGELFVGGVGVARGYRNRPALTEERFLPDPFSGQGTRLYRTGDMVRYRADGNLEYVGRSDGQVKIRGFRVEIGEVEAALRESPGIFDAAVVARQEGTGETRLIAYVIADPSVPSSVSDLRRRLVDRLPGYMIPSAFVPLEALPRTPSGKLAVGSLPPPDTARPVVEGADDNPRTPAEEALVSIFARLLRIDRVGIHENFFELGGHSLLATQVISRARDAFNVRLPLREFFLNPTVAGLALTIAQRQAAAVPSDDLDRLLTELEASGGDAR